MNLDFFNYNLFDFGEFASKLIFNAHGLIDSIGFYHITVGDWNIDLINVLMFTSVTLFVARAVVKFIIA